MRFALFLAVTLLMLPSLSRADQLQDGKAAYDRHDGQAALKLLRPLADSGNAEAQYDVGQLYHASTDIEKDDAEAMKWYRRAADQGYAEAQAAIGLMYEYDQSIKQDYAEAYFWLSLCCTDSGAPEAHEAIGEAAANLSSEQRAAVDKRVKEWKPILEAEPAHISAKPLGVAPRPAEK